MLTQAAQPPLDERAAGLLRLDNRWIGRIDEDCALHVRPLLWRSSATAAPSIRPHEPPCPRYERIAFVASPIPERSRRRSGSPAATAMSIPTEADVIVALGGDGLMLQTLHSS